ncbi:hypothetical protein EON68_04690, partial [archaeon]
MSSAILQDARVWRDETVSAQEIVNICTPALSWDSAVRAPPPAASSAASAPALVTDESEAVESAVSASLARCQLISYELQERVGQAMSRLSSGAPAAAAACSTFQADAMLLAGLSSNTSQGSSAAKGEAQPAVPVEAFAMFERVQRRLREVSGLLAQAARWDALLRSAAVSSALRDPCAVVL